MVDGHSLNSDGSSYVECPKCSGDMESQVVHGVATDRCAVCGGLWLEALGRERLMTHAEAAVEVDTGEPAIGAEMNAQQRIDCPNCKAAMIHMVDVDQPHVGFEACTVCGGVFLDAGELRDLADFTRSEKFKALWRRLKHTI